MEKEALELARRGGESEQRAAWRDETDSEQEDEDHKSRRDRREREGDKKQGSGERESRQRHLRSYQTSRSKSPNRVCQPV